MPTYDYRCNACGHEFEEFQMMSDGVLRKCPECGKLKLERLIGSGAGFVFKGSGYYVTDYRSKSYDDAKKADTAEKKSSDSGGSKKKSD
jgi:putative FmdB family regulatory protein